TLEVLGQGAGYNEVLLATNREKTADATDAVSDRVRSALQQEGVTVLAAVVPPPGRFWADDQIAATVLLLDTLAVLAVVMSGFLFSASVFGLQVATAVMVAVVAALRPVIGAGRLTVREAIASEGSGGARRAGRWTRPLRTPARLSARNAFRRRGRLALTLAAL